MRGAATSALGRLGDIVPEYRKNEIIEHLTPHARRPVVPRPGLVDQRAVDAEGFVRRCRQLDRTAQRALDGRVVRTARIAAQSIRSAGDKGDEVKKLREEMDKLNDENRTLKDRLDKIEARLTEQRP